MAMRRSDRRTSNDDNAQQHLRSRQPESVSPRELRMRLNTVRSQRDEAKDELRTVQVEKSELLQNIQAVQEERDRAQSQLVLVEASVVELEVLTEEWKLKADDFHQLYLNEQGKVQVAQQQAATASEQMSVLHTELEQLQVDVQSWQGKADENHQLYTEEKNKYDTLFISYQEERERASQLLTQYERADSERLRYVSLYEEVREDLKTERRSKAGIKGWETRRKRENERLKREIADMVILLKESMDRKEEAVENLELVAARMDRIQDLVDFAEEEGTTPVGMLQKFQRIWRAIREILAE